MCALVGFVPLVVACGSDHQQKLIQLDDPVLGETEFDPNTHSDECLTSVTCEDGDLCTENRCIDRVCVNFDLPTEECCETDVLFSEGFDGTIQDGVTFTQLNGTAGWHVIESAGRSASPPRAVYFGNTDSMSYDTGVHVAGEMALPPLDLPTDRKTVLAMRIFAAIETSVEFDLFTIRADVIEGGSVSKTVDVLAKRGLPADAFNGFALVDVDMSELAGRRVILRFAFDSIDDLNNGYEGVWIDDIQVLASCPIPAACESDVMCDDGDACTANVCNPEVGCLRSTVCALPDPELPVETDPCAADGAPEDCCTSDNDCNDGNPDTINICNGATCEVTLNPDSCQFASDCDDGESCTVETCGGGICSFAGTLGAGCCTPAVELLADFDNETLQGIYVTDNFETGIFWTPDKTRATSGQFALYCGDPVTQTYTHDRRVKSSATTRAITVSKGGQSRLTFDLYKHTRLAKNYDVFQVNVLRDGALLPAWTSRSLTDGTTEGGWQRITVPLDTYAGQEIQVRFVFDSVDAPTGLFEGVYMDSIRLHTICQ